VSGVATPVLAADIGNSHTVLGLVADGEVSAHWRVATVQEWRAMLAGPFGSVPSVVVEPGVRTGMSVLTDQPREVGTDRIVNALAAGALYGGPAVVVDFGGTATTFDVINARGQYIGGAISPGIEISLDALERRGAQLRMVELKRPRTVIARNTVEALQSGMVFGVASQVDGIVGRMLEELGKEDGGDQAEDRAETAVVATGYLAPLVLDECNRFTAHEPWLTLRGLELVYRRNA
jgi:type III pantothenate kinase